MGAELLSSKLVVQEEAPSLRTVPGVPTAIGAIVGIFQKGPVGVATLVTSDAEAERIFGSDVVDGVGREAVRGFFANGGQQLYVVRTVHYTNPATPGTKTSVKATFDLQTPATAPTAGAVLGSVAEPFSLSPGQTLSVDIDGGGAALATFLATAAQVTGAATGPFALVDGWEISFDVDGVTRNVTFDTAEFVDISNATAQEVVDVINAEVPGIAAVVSANAVRITSDTLGTDSDIDNFADVSGAAVAALGLTGLSDTGTGNVADILAVTVAEVKTVVEAAVAGCTVNNVAGAVQIVSNTTGASSSVLVEAVSTADTAIGLDNATHTGSTGAAVATLRLIGKYDGAYANAITALIQTATSGKTAEFNLVVLFAGVVVERFPNLSMDDSSDRYVETVVNDVNTGSNYISVLDLDANPANPDLERPADSPGTPPVAFGPLAGGDDGLVGIDDNDFIGTDAGKTGIRGFDMVNPNVLFVPDRPTAAVHNAQVTYCEVTRDLSMFAVLDPPAGLDKSAIVTYVESTAGLENLSEFGMIYWPQVKVLNPNKAVFGNSDNIVVPASGRIAGMIRRTDASREGGVYEPPAGIEKGRLLGVTGLETDSVLEEAVRDFIAPHRINPITKLPNQPIALDDSMTLKGGGNFPSISERRGVTFIEQSLKAGLQFARQRNNDASLRAEVERSITSFLLTQMRVNAFRSQEASKAFFVDVSEAINPASEQFAGKLNVRVGLATQKPARFIILSFSQDTRAIDEEIAAAGA